MMMAVTWTDMTWPVTMMMTVGPGRAGPVVGPSEAAFFRATLPPERQREKDVHSAQKWADDAPFSLQQRGPIYLAVALVYGQTHTTLWPAGAFTPQIDRCQLNWCAGCIELVSWCCCRCRCRCFCLCCWRRRCPQRAQWRVHRPHPDACHVLGPAAAAYLCVCM